LERRALLVIILIAGVSACSGVREQVVTEANRDAVTTSVIQSSLLDEDKRLFVAFVGRTAAAYDHGRWSDTKSPYDGKTVAAIIEDERLRLTATRAGEEQRAKIAAAATVEASALASAIGKALSVAVLDTRTTQFGVLPYSYVKVIAENISGKAIAGFAGRLTIRDMFGDEVGHAAVDVTEPIHAGARITWEELVSDAGVGKTAARHLKFEWTPEQVTFRDGSQLGPVKPAAR
jgi:hypothetical protein